MIRCRGVDKPRWLLAIDHLIQMTMEKCILDIQLMDRLGMRNGNAEDGADGRWLDHRTEGLVVVYPMLLRKPADNPLSLVTSQGTIGVVFMLVNPFAEHHISSWRPGNQLPSVIINECLIDTLQPWQRASWDQLEHFDSWQESEMPSHRWQ